MFVEDYAELNLPGTERVAKRCFLFEHFIEELLSNDPARFPSRKKRPRSIIMALHV